MKIAFATVQATRKRTATLWKVVSHDQTVPTSLLDFVVTLEQRISDLEAACGFSEEDADAVFATLDKVDTQGR